MRRQANVCTIFSFVPLHINEHKPGLLPPFYQIPASDGITPNRLVVKQGSHHVYMGEDRTLPVVDTAESIAKSVVEDFLNSQIGRTEDAYPAIFYVPGELSVEEVLLEEAELIALLQECQKRWFLNIARMADDDWTKARKHNHISDFQRKAAAFLGWDPESHPWMAAEVKEVTATKVCKACTSTINKLAVICPICRCVLDKTKHAEMAFA
jgi:hypothetical protein